MISITQVNCKINDFVIYFYLKPKSFLLDVYLLLFEVTSKEKFLLAYYLNISSNHERFFTQTKFYPKPAVAPACSTIDQIDQKSLLTDLIDLCYNMFMLSDRAEATKLLTQRLPLNSLGLPEGLYRPDLLVPATATSQNTAPTTTDVFEEDNQQLTLLPALSNGHQHSNGHAQPQGQAQVLSIEPTNVVDTIDASLKALGFDPEHIEIAYKRLNYVEGFPTFEDGSPLWEQMDCESEESHTAFKAYLAQVRNGARQLFLLPMALPKDLQRLTMEDLKEFYYLHYWSFRAKAFDMYAEVVRRKQMERRALETQDYHFFESQKILDKVLEKMRPVATGEVDENGDPVYSDFWEDISPKVLVDLLTKLVSIQRISAGLPSAGPPAPSQNGREASPYAVGTSANQSIEILLRSVAQQSGAVTLDRDGNPITGQGGGSSGEDDILEQALKDPETAGMIQELVIKLGTNG